MPPKKYPRPLGDRVLVRPDSQEAVTESGIVLVRLDKEKQYAGEVLAVGEDPAITVKPGQHVHYEKGVQYTIHLDGEELDFVSYYDIVCVEE